jgi:hypothetical protein
MFITANNQIKNCHPVIARIELIRVFFVHTIFVFLIHPNVKCHVVFNQVNNYLYALNVRNLIVILIAYFTIVQLYNATKMSNIFTKDTVAGLLNIICP